MYWGLSHHFVKYLTRVIYEGKRVILAQVVLKVQD